MNRFKNYDQCDWLVHVSVATFLAIIIVALVYACVWAAGMIGAITWKAWFAIKLFAWTGCFFSVTIDRPLLQCNNR